MAENLLNSPEKIVKRLEELRIWQEEQESLLKERQETQRKLLSDEQQKLYELLGLSAISENFSDISKISYVNEITEQNTHSINNSKLKESNSSNVNTPSDKHKRSYNNSISNDVVQTENIIKENKENLPKRRFLKRGEGLKSRFKIDPDRFRLNNLPRYKYAGKHKRFHPLKTIQSNEETIQLNRDTSSSPIVMNKHYLCLEKLQIPSKKKQTQNHSPHIQSDFQISPVDKNQNSHDLSIFNSSEKLSVFNSVEKKSEDNKIEKKIEPISWAKVLDTNNIEPISVDSFRDNTKDESKQNSLGEDTLFDLLEQKAEEGSFALDAINIKKWIKSKAKELQDESEALKINTEHMKKSKIQPFPFDVDNILIPDETDSYITSSNDDDSTDIQNYEETINCKSVRFADQIIEINNTDESETETVRSIEYNNTSNCTPNFERFKQNLFPVERQDNESTLVEEAVEEWDCNRQEIIEKSELLKKRLNEVETEITRFKQSNLDLMKMKQEHELDKARFEQECAEICEQLKNERVKFEIYTHDERLKVENEKRKVEKLLRDQRLPNRKERDETIKLKEELEAIQKELKGKESKHVSAQARLRAQLRNNEKEIKDLMFEIEHLKKDKKKLESENTRLNRLESNKMLKEINKTIAKLAPKNSIDESRSSNTGNKVTEVRNQNTKPVVAKVVKHVLSSNDDISSVSSDSSDISEPIEQIKFKHGRSLKPELKKKQIEPMQNNSSDVYSSKNTKEFKREIKNDDGSKEIWYANGNIKKISSDEMLIRMLYFNKDIKETNVNEGTIKYYYAETNTWQTSYLDGLDIFEFPNGIIEHRHKDGTIETHHPNGAIRKTDPNDKEKSEEWIYSDGTQFIKLKNDETILKMPNGQREIRTKLQSRREYPDGTVKILYPDGSQETRYSNGRVRVKDKNGTLLMDSIKY